MRSSQGEAQLAKAQEQQTRHARSAQRRREHLHALVAKANDESEKVKEIKFIKQLETEDIKVALDERLRRSEARRQELLALRQLRGGREVESVLETAQRRKTCAPLLPPSDTIACHIAVSRRVVVRYR